MSLISGFENDIFISYAHKDNSSVAQEWVKQFYVYLKDMLIRSTGRSDIGIWWDDKKMDGNTYFDQSIRKGLDKSAIIICLHSPSYIQSEWCIKELETFAKITEEDGIGVMVGDDARIVHVLLYNMDRNQWPAAFGGRTGLPFYEAIDEGDQGDPLEVSSNEFHSGMKSLRNSLLRLFKGFSEVQEATPTAQTAPAKEASDQVAIFFGDIPDSLGDRPRRIISELEKKGFQIIADIPTHDVATHEIQVKEAVEKAQLAVHFLDQYPGKMIPGEQPNWIRKKEIELTLESNVSQLIWTTSDFDFSSIEEEEYKQFLEHLEHGQLGEKNYDFIRSVKGNLIQEVVEHADQLKNNESAMVSAAEKFNVLIDNHSKDLEFAFELNNKFSEREITTYLTPMEDDPMNNNEKLRNYISKSRKFIFVYGKVEKDWLNARLTTALKILLDYGRSAKDMIVYMTPPEKQADTIKIKEQGIPIQIIDSSKDPSEREQKIDQLLTELTTDSNGKK